MSKIIRPNGQLVDLTNQIMASGKQNAPQVMEERIYELPDTCFVHPVSPYILIEPQDIKDMLAPDSKLVTTDAPARWREGTVLEIPTGKKEDGTDIFWGWPYNVGHKVLFNPFSGIPLMKKGKNLELIPVNQIIGFISNEVAAAETQPAQ